MIASASVIGTEIVTTRADLTKEAVEVAAAAAVVETETWADRIAMNDTSRTDDALRLDTRAIDTEEQATVDTMVAVIVTDKTTIELQHRHHADLEQDRPDDDQLDPERGPRRDRRDPRHAPHLALQDPRRAPAQVRPDRRDRRVARPDHLGRPLRPGRAVTTTAKS